MPRVGEPVPASGQPVARQTGTWQVSARQISARQVSARQVLGRRAVRLTARPRLCCLIARYLWFWHLPILAVTGSGRSPRRRPAACRRRTAVRTVPRNRISF
jgi:hypothetical protein